MAVDAGHPRQEEATLKYAQVTSLTGTGQSDETREQCLHRGEEQCSPSFHFLCILAPADRGNHACAATCWWSGRPQAGEPQVAATKRSSDTQVPIPSFPKYRNRTGGPSTEMPLLNILWRQYELRSSVCNHLLDGQVPIPSFPN